MTQPEIVALNNLTISPFDRHAVPENFLIDRSTYLPLTSPHSLVVGVKTDDLTAVISLLSTAFAPF